MSQVYYLNNKQEETHTLCGLLVFLLAGNEEDWQIILQCSHCR